MALHGYHLSKDCPVIGYGCGQCNKCVPADDPRLDHGHSNASSTDQVDKTPSRTTSRKITESPRKSRRSSPRSGPNPAVTSLDV